MARLDEFLPVYDVVEARTIATCLRSPEDGCRGLRSRPLSLQTGSCARCSGCAAWGEVGRCTARCARWDSRSSFARPACVVVGAAGRPWTPARRPRAVRQGRPRPSSDAARGSRPRLPATGHFSTPETRVAAMDDRSPSGVRRYWRRRRPVLRAHPYPLACGSRAGACCVDGGLARLPVGDSLRRDERRPARRPQPSLGRRSCNALHRWGGAGRWSHSLPRREAPDRGGARRRSLAVFCSPG